IRETGGGAGVVELDACVVLFDSDRVEAKVFVIDTVEARTDAALHDQIVSYHLIEDHKTRVMSYHFEIRATVRDRCVDGWSNGRFRCRAHCCDSFFGAARQND